MKTSAPSKSKIFWGVFLLATAIGWLRVISGADRQGYFVDEVLFHSLAAFHLFSTGNYYSLAFPQIFDPTLASDIFTTWPSGLVWIFHGNLLTQRLIFASLYWIEALALLTFFLRKRGVALPAALCASSIAWLLILRMPYWQGFLQNLAELPGAFLLGAALLALSYDRDKLGFVCVGLAVWGCKIIYVPVAFAFGLAYLWLNRRSVRKCVEAALSFFLPVLPKIFYICIVFGLSEGLSWLPRALLFVVRGPSGLQSKGPSPTLLERLQTLEWGTYGWGMKAKILLFLFAPLLMLGTLRWKKISEKEKAYSLATVFVVLLYSFWWFFLHPQMFARHIQPGLYLGLGFLMYWFFDWSQRSDLSKIAWAFSILVMGIEVTAIPSYWPPLQKEGSYARACSGELETLACSPELERFRKVNEEEIERKRDHVFKPPQSPESP